ncbi:class I SAM-dependent methyltransferase [Eubacteriaceae bacterium ES2]|nr:class I SAM-dependent methyltransferase [Eubacteriaceae bacterium ES2]
MSKQNIFDDEEFFEGFIKISRDHSHAENLIEKPALFSLVPDLKGKKVLDLGCGVGEASIECVRLGARQVIGTDISKKMLAVAREKNASEKIDYRNICMEDVALLSGGFDLVISSMAIHFVEDFDLLLEDLYHLLKPGGVLLFSQDHPLKNCSLNTNQASLSQNNNIAYRQEGKIISDWIVAGVIKYHRTFATLINSLVSKGLMIDGLLEPVADQEIIAMYPRYEKCLDHSDYLIIRAHKAE